MGKSDTCEELNLLRKFRDDYMKNNQEGKDLVKKYYKLALGIVKRINSDKDKDKYYNYIYSKVYTA
jgi:hypothetical protein